eukprot:XP_001710193.1 Hypothetical protein GL50803_4370 [Giardia lamblia ATCC 50803]
MPIVPSSVGCLVDRDAPTALIGMTASAFLFAASGIAAEGPVS